MNSEPLENRGHYALDDAQVAKIESAAGFKLTNSEHHVYDLGHGGPVDFYVDGFGRCVSVTGETFVITFDHPPWAVDLSKWLDDTRQDGAHITTQF